MLGKRLINTGGGVDCVDVFGDSSGKALYQLNGNANDVSGNYNGTATNITYGTGVFGQAGVFNGSNGVITTTAGFTGNPTFSLSFWVNNISTPFNEPIFGFGSPAGGKALIITVTSAKKIGFDVWAQGVASTPSSIPNGVWTHIAISTNAGNIKAYINGSLNLSFSWTLNLTSNNLFIGSELNQGGYFKGSIDQVRVFNKEISAGEVTTLYTSDASCG